MNRKLLNVLKNQYMSLYEPYGGSEDTFASLISVLQRRIDERSEDLKKLDRRSKHWFMSEKMIGMMLYVDLFAGNLKKLKSKIPYLKELGVTYVHLMPLLKPRPGENDGGYAVEDYEDIDPKLGTLKDFINVLDAFRAANIAVCIDYVLNHTSDTHQWAKKALAGEAFYMDMYEMYDSREIPDKYDEIIPEVLPVKHPGNFTYKKEIDKWVFTSFSDFQWDLNFKNPYVFESMIDIMLKLANMGVNMLRLDAIAFMWKEPGTTCRNLPQAHHLLKMFNTVKDLVCPSLALLGEAIVQPHEIFKYFGDENDVECGLLYNANFMVNIFNTMATRDVRLMELDNSEFIVPHTGSFMNYIRCHDDIGWGFNEKAITKMGMDPFFHKQFLIDFYSRGFDGSFAKGEIYQYNPKNEDARTNGTLASLMGLDLARHYKDSHARIFSLNRIKLIFALIYGYRGIPLIYSGDEIASLNDQSYKEDVEKSADGRWVHRPYFDWQRAKKRNDLATDEGQIFSYLQRLAKVRKKEKLFHGAIEAHTIDLDNNHIYAFFKRHKGEAVICLFNFSENNQYFDSDAFKLCGLKGIKHDLITGKEVSLDETNIHMYPYECLWLK